MRSQSPEYIQVAATKAMKASLAGKTEAGSGLRVHRRREKEGGQW